MVPTYLWILLFQEKEEGRKKLEFCVFVEPIWASIEELNNLVSPKPHYNMVTLVLRRKITRVQLRQLNAQGSNGKLFLNLKKDRFPSWVHVNNTGPRASREKLRYCTVVTGDLCLLLLRFRWERDNTPVWEFIFTEYIHPCIFNPVSKENDMNLIIRIYVCMYRAAHLCISTKYEMTCMIEVHRGNFSIKYWLINYPSCAKIEHLVHCKKLRKINWNKKLTLVRNGKT